MKKKLSKNSGKNYKGTTGNTENTGVKTKRKMGKKNARGRKIWYEIPDEFDAEKLKVLNAAYVCANCNHRGNINGCSCKKPGILSTKVFRYKCLDYCGGELFNQRDYEEHQNMHLNVRPFVCGLCNKTFTAKILLNRHSQVHVVDKPYKCDECHEGFMSSRDMEIHTRTHTGEKTYICEDCGNGYTNVDNLQIHRLSHSGKEPFKCGNCKKVFIEKSLRDIHELSHTSKGPLPCQFCGKLLSDQSNLNKHKKRVHKDKNPAVVTCYSCRATFDNYDELLEHCQQHYSEPAHKRQCCKPTKDDVNDKNPKPESKDPSTVRSILKRKGSFERSRVGLKKKKPDQETITSSDEDQVKKGSPLASTPLIVPKKSGGRPPTSSSDENTPVKCSNDAIARRGGTRKEQERFHTQPIESKSPETPPEKRKAKAMTARHLTQPITVGEKKVVAKEHEEVDMSKMSISESPQTAKRIKPKRTRPTSQYPLRALADRKDIKMTNEEGAKSGIPEMEVARVKKKKSKGYVTKVEREARPLSPSRWPPQKQPPNPKPKGPHPKPVKVPRI